jgi:hypothetical protein
LTKQGDEARIASGKSVAEHNSEQLEKALLALDRIVRERLASGMPGAIGVRIPFQRNRLGNVRVIREDEW